MSDPVIFPQVQPHDWPGQEQAVFKPIHAQLQPGEGPQTLPLVGWSYAAGPMAAFISPGWLEKTGKSVDEVHEESLANLQAGPFEPRILDMGRAPEEKAELAVLELSRGSNPNHVAAADHILNRQAMLALQQRLVADPMVVAIPYAEALFAAGVGLAQSGAFLNLAMQDPPEGSTPMTAMVFLIQEGQIVGKVTYGAA